MDKSKITNEVVNEKDKTNRKKQLHHYGLAYEKNDYSTSEGYESGEGSALAGSCNPVVLPDGREVASSNK